MRIKQNGIRALLGLLLIFCISAYAEPRQNGNTVEVLLEGYVKPIKGREFLPGATDNGARKVASTIALVKGKDVLIMIDPGMVADAGLIISSLKQRNIEPKDITHVFISHHHPDHTVNVGLFPNAEVVDFWGRYKGDIWQDHGDGYELAPGIKVLSTPGHTKEDASLVVDTSQGIFVFTHLWWFSDMSPAKDPLAWDQDALEKYRKHILKIADWIVPGHGEMFKNPHRKTDSPHQ